MLETHYNTLLNRHIVLSGSFPLFSVTKLNVFILISAVYNMVIQRRHREINVRLLIKCWKGDVSEKPCTSSLRSDNQPWGFCVQFEFLCVVKGHKQVQQSAVVGGPMGGTDTKIGPSLAKSWVWAGPPLWDINSLLHIFTYWQRSNQFARDHRSSRRVLLMLTGCYNF